MQIIHAHPLIWDPEQGFVALIKKKGYGGTC